MDDFTFLKTFTVDDKRNTVLVKCTPDLKDFEVEIESPGTNTPISAWELKSTMKYNGHIVNPLELYKEIQSILNKASNVKEIRLSLYVGTVLERTILYND